MTHHPIGKDKKRTTMSNEPSPADVPLDDRRYVLCDRQGIDVLGGPVGFGNAYISQYPTKLSGPVPCVRDLAVDQTVTVEISMCGPRKAGDRDSRYSIIRVV